jgi:hypothetical protein
MVSRRSLIQFGIEGVAYFTWLPPARADDDCDPGEILIPKTCVDDDGSFVDCSYCAPDPNYHPPPATAPITQTPPVDTPVDVPTVTVDPTSGSTSFDPIDAATGGRYGTSDLAAQATGVFAGSDSGGSSWGVEFSYSSSSAVTNQFGGLSPLHQEATSSISSGGQAQNFNDFPSPPVAASQAASNYQTNFYEPPAGSELGLINLGDVYPPGDSPQFTAMGGIISSRTPDYYVLSFAASWPASPSEVVVLDRYGYSYFSAFGAGGGYSLSGLPLSAYVTANWLLESTTPSEEVLHAFLTTSGFGAADFFLLGGTYSRTPGVGDSFGFGAGVPQVGGGYSYSYAASDIAESGAQLVEAATGALYYFGIVEPNLPFNDVPLWP